NSWKHPAKTSRYRNMELGQHAESRSSERQRSAELFFVSTQPNYKSVDRAMIAISALRALAAAGATVEMVIAAVEAQQAEDEKAITIRRQKDAARQRKCRASKVSRMSRG